MFLQLLSGIKVKLVDKVMQSHYLCVTLHVKRKKLILTVLPDFYFLIKFKMAAKMATIFGDVTDLQQRHHP